MSEQGKWKRVLIYSAELIGGIVAAWLLGYVIYAFAMV